MTRIAAEIEPNDRLKFRDSKKYKDRLTAAQKETGKRCAGRYAWRLDGLPVVAVAFEFTFMGGSMGAVVGEKFVRAATIALEERLPPDLLCCFWWGTDARSTVFTHADGQNLGSA